VSEDVVHRHGIERTPFANYLKGDHVPDSLLELLDQDEYDERGIVEMFRQEANDSHLARGSALNLWDWLIRCGSAEQLTNELLDFSDGWRAGREVTFKFDVRLGGSLAAWFRSYDDPEWHRLREDPLPLGGEIKEMERLGFVPLP
jgi:hypothetical protein